jgi:hypothetical protein
MRADLWPDLLGKSLRRTCRESDGLYSHEKLGFCDSMGVSAISTPPSGKLPRGGYIARTISHSGKLSSKTVQYVGLCP